MGSSSPATTTQQQNTTTTANPWAAATPLLNNLIGGYTGVNPAVTPGQAQAGQNLTTAAAGIPNLTPQATQSVQQLFQNAGMIPAAYQQTQQNLSPIAGANLNPFQTPGFSDALAKVNQDALNAVKGVYAGSGRSPSGAGDFGKTFAQAVLPQEAAAVSGQYNQNVGNVLSAQQMLQNAGINTAQGMGNVSMQALQQAGLLPSLAMGPAAQQLNAANIVQGQPVQNLNALLQPGAVLGGLGGTTTGTGYSTGQQMPANNPLMNVLGGVSAGAGLLGALGGSGGIMSLAPLLAMSDRRLKTNIKDIGRTHDNQKIYSYRFKAGGPPQIGMMADEIAKKMPEAVVTGPDGMKAVRYDLATRKAAKMGMLSARQAPQQEAA
jgi:hypothetical protein